MDNLKVYLPVFAPLIIALTSASIVTIFASFFKGDRQTIIQCLLFSICFSLAIAYLQQNSTSELDVFLKALQSLRDETKLALSFSIICIVYFGGSFYVTSGGSTVGSNASSLLSTPASCDSVVEFDIPTSLPEDDTQLFELVFDK